MKGRLGAATATLPAPPTPIEDGLALRRRFRAGVAEACRDMAARMDLAYGIFGWTPERIATVCTWQVKNAAANPEPLAIPVAATWGPEQIEVIASINRLRRVLSSWMVLTGGPLDEGTLETLVAMARRAGLGQEVLV